MKCFRRQAILTYNPEMGLTQHLGSECHQKVGMFGPRSKLHYCPCLFDSLNQKPGVWPATNRILRSRVPSDFSLFLPSSFSSPTAMFLWHQIWPIVTTLNRAPCGTAPWGAQRGIVSSQGTWDCSICDWCGGDLAMILPPPPLYPLWGTEGVLSQAQGL